ncbi:MAG: acetoin:2,6-dichlorophenolindophenol oxidoreductase subunit beta [Parcubacteria group bacterium LiPW_30]|nr:MAG: acetoin:2,6-dichlorophenolindophenol oxidoreductase subunit beta [Parcubacteria group bacterium LiPW_30]
MPPRIIKYTEAIKEATDQIMEIDPSVFVIGLGVAYKNGADGTTSGLKLKYENRVFDVPVSEASFTGMSVGAAINGLKPIVHHGRVEFAYFAADQIFTQAAKWNYMFGGDNGVPIVLRIAVGRQWGNGPQHTQSPYALFGGAMGLKVVIPSTPKMAKGLLISAVKDKNPVIFLESRWLYNTKQEVPAEVYEESLDKAKVFKEGKDITVVAYGDGFIASLEALDFLNNDVSVELIDLVSINPIDYETIFNSVKKTGRLMCVDTTHEAFNIGSEIISKVVQNSSIDLKERPTSISCPNVPCPTSTALTEFYYPTKVDIANLILKQFNKPKIDKKLSFEELHLAPGLTIL